MATAIPFLSLQNITARYLNQVLFQNMDFTIHHGENWALVGKNDSGKNDLLKAIAGQMNISKGSIKRFFFEEFMQKEQPKDPFFNYHKLQALVSHRHNFRNLSNTTDFYYQQRYNSFDADDAPVVQQQLEGQLANGIKGYWNYENVLETFKLESLQDKQLIKLSNGETKRMLMASAVIKNPRLLLLDQPLTGLDVQTRAEFSQIIGAITSSGITVVMATSPHEIPEGITHVAVVQDGRIVQQLKKEDFHPREHLSPPKPPEAAELKDLLALDPQQRFTTIVQMENVSVSYGEKAILRNINWEVKSGERWALLGPNGAGKTTLLSLINGDNPQAYANKITLFDCRRGSGESIWDIKKNIGFVSPELYQYFPTDHTLQQVVESGFYDTPGLFRKSTAQNKEIALRWMKLLNIEKEAEKFLSMVPISLQRLCLLARALVKNPPLLILDEPCQGLEEEQKNHFKWMLETICAESNTSLIYVTHYQDEIPACVHHTLQLREGEVVERE